MLCTEQKARKTYRCTTDMSTLCFNSHRIQFTCNLTGLPLFNGSFCFEKKMTKTKKQIATIIAEVNIRLESLNPVLSPKHLLSQHFCPNLFWWFSTLSKICASDPNTTLNLWKKMCNVSFPLAYSVPFC